MVLSGVSTEGKKYVVQLKLFGNFNIPLSIMNGTIKMEIKDLSHTINQQTE